VVDTVLFLVVGLGFAGDHEAFDECGDFGLIGAFALGEDLVVDGLLVVGIELERELAFGEAVGDIVGAEIERGEEVVGFLTLGVEVDGAGGDGDGFGEGGCARGGGLIGEGVGEEVWVRLSSGCCLAAVRKVVRAAAGSWAWLLAMPSAAATKERLGSRRVAVSKSCAASEGLVV